MSYNITSFTVKKTENLIAPLEAFFKNSRHKDSPRLTLNGMTEDGTFAAKIDNIDCNDGEITGTINGNALTIQGIEMDGEGSGTGYNEVLIPALEASTGYFEALIVWEGGDHIEHLVCVDGVVTSKSAEFKAQNVNTHQVSIFRSELHNVYNEFVCMNCSYASIFSGASYCPGCGGKIT